MHTGVSQTEGGQGKEHITGPQTESSTSQGRETAEYLGQGLSRDSESLHVSGRSQSTQGPENGEAAMGGSQISEGHP